jgi:hypothetical protein
MGVAGVQDLQNIGECSCIEKFYDNSSTFGSAIIEANRNHRILQLLQLLLRPLTTDNRQLTPHWHRHFLFPGTHPKKG